MNKFAQKDKKMRVIQCGSRLWSHELIERGLEPNCPNANLFVLRLPVLGSGAVALLVVIKVLASQNMKWFVRFS